MSFFTSYDWLFWLTVVYAMVPIMLLIEDERKRKQEKRDSDQTRR